MMHRRRRRRRKRRAMRSWRRVVMRCSYGRCRMVIITFATGFTLAVATIFVVVTFVFVMPFVMTVIVIHNRCIVVMVVRRLRIGIACKAEEGACREEKCIKLEAFHRDLQYGVGPLHVTSVFISNMNANIKISLITIAITKFCPEP